MRHVYVRVKAVRLHRCVWSTSFPVSPGCYRWYNSSFHIIVFVGFPLLLSSVITAAASFIPFHAATCSLFRPLSAYREVSRRCVRWPQTQKPSSSRVCCLRPAPQQLQPPQRSPPWCCDLLSPLLPQQPPALPRPKPQSSASLRRLTVNLDW